MDQNTLYMYRRLGKRELGPYAFETQMPSSLRALLASEDESNKVAGVIPKLAQLLEHENRITNAYLCADTAVQVFRIPHEGGTFCGYRSIQMLLLSLQLTVTALKPAALNVLDIQNLIEEAWANGHNVHGREQTNGIRNSRKHIGTFEAQALLSQLGIACSVDGYYSENAQRELLDFVGRYFYSADERPASINSKIHRIRKAPIYLQRPGHSLIIVGIEEDTHHRRRLLAFDPGWTPPSLMRIVGPLPDSVATNVLRRKWILRQYRKPARYLRRSDAYETISITVNEP